ncbi:MAG: DUF47 family protein [Staphylothermus sp.]|nr:DUF47 family protein [Staphylothermus sp.]
MFREILPEQIIMLLEEYVDKLNDIAESFKESISLLNEMRTGEARKKLADTMRIENEADRIRRKIIEFLEESRIDPGFKQDFFHFIKVLDRIIDWIKEASRELTVLPYLEIPQPLREGIEDLVEKVVEATEKIAEATKHTLQGNYEEATRIISEIEKIEEEADEINVNNRGKLLELADNIKPYTMAILIHDLNQDLEEAADSCEDAGDYLRAMLVSWKRR